MPLDPVIPLDTMIVDKRAPIMPKQYTTVKSAMEFDCVSLCEINEYKSQNTRQFLMPVSGVICEPRSVASDVQAMLIQVLNYKYRKN